MISCLLSQCESVTIEASRDAILHYIWNVIAKTRAGNELGRSFDGGSQHNSCCRTPTAKIDTIPVTYMKEYARFGMKAVFKYATMK